MLKKTLWVLLTAIIGLSFLSALLRDPLGLAAPKIAPDWQAIANWPSQSDVSRDLEAVPNPNRKTTVIVLDDSGSMGGNMAAAKSAVITALDAMAGDDLVAVVALNAGLMTAANIEAEGGFLSAQMARQALPGMLEPLGADGSTPLTRAVALAQTLLEEQAQRARGFGTYRMIVTTDGVADNGEALRTRIEKIARDTPIQVATIGIDIKGNHVLKRRDITSYVDVSNISDLADALRTAIAENAEFSAITEFKAQ